MKNNKKRGFTIVELVIVIAVIAILAAVLIPTFSNVVKKANLSAELQQIRNAWYDYLASDSADVTRMGEYDIEIASTVDTSVKYYVHNGSFIGQRAAAPTDNYTAITVVTYDSATHKFSGKLN